MSHKRWQTIQAASFAVLTLLAVVYVVMKYGEHLSRVRWSLVTVICALLFGVYLMYKAASDENNNYDVITLVTTDGTADLYKHIIILFAGLSAWTVVQLVLKGQSVETLLLGILGIFILKKVGDRVGDAIASRPAAPDPVGNTQINAPNADTVVAGDMPGNEPPPGKRTRVRS